MTILVLGLILWWGAHLWKRWAPHMRARLGDAGKGIVAALLALSLVLMVWGYRHAAGPVWWGPGPAAKGITDLLVLVAVYLFAASGMKTRLGLRLHHPQLLAVSLWALGHLLVRGTLEGIVLFGGLLAWALVEMTAINRADPDWVPPPAPLSWRREWLAIGGAVVVYALIGLIHGRIGPNPWGA